MKRNILLVGFVILYLSGYSQQSTLVKGKDYTGYAFNKEHFVFMSIDNQKERYTPTTLDIIQAEKIVRDSIDNYLKREKIYTHSIKQNKLKKYKRQYVGFKTLNGDIVIYIAFLKDVDNKDKLSKDIAVVYDGGETYWRIFVNLKKNILFGIHINGKS